MKMWIARDFGGGLYHGSNREYFDFIKAKIVKVL